MVKWVCVDEPRRQRLSQADLKAVIDKSFGMLGYSALYCGIVSVFLGFHLLRVNIPGG